MHDSFLSHPSWSGSGSLLTAAAITGMLAWWLNTHVAGNLASVPLVKSEGARKADPFICYLILALDVTCSVLLIGTFLGGWVNKIINLINSLGSRITVGVIAIFGTYLVLMLLTDLLLKHDVRARTRWHGRMLPFVATAIPGLVGSWTVGAVSGLGSYMASGIGHLL